MFFFFFLRFSSLRVSPSSFLWNFGVNRHLWRERNSFRFLEYDTHAGGARRGGVGGGPKMSKKKTSRAVMTLKDFHGGSIPSDLPLPSAPGM